MIASILHIELPTGQSSHSVWPVSSTYVPAGHNVQVSSPIAALYLPIPHESQSSGPISIQLLTDVGPCKECVSPFGQTVQAWSPDADLCVPTGYGAHEPARLY